MNQCDMHSRNIRAGCFYYLSGELSGFVTGPLAHSMSVLVVAQRDARQLAVMTVTGPRTAAADNNLLLDIFPAFVPSALILLDRIELLPPGGELGCNRMHTET